MPADLRVGHGYDFHRLDPLPPLGMGTPLIVGGVRFDHDRGPVAHSDGDVLFHAATDALLGAIGEPDIGQLFPDNDGRNKGRDSREFLKAAAARAVAAGWRIANIDCTVVLERLRLAPVKEAIRASLASTLACAGVESITQVNVKGKSHEGLDSIGQGCAIEAHVVVLLMRETSA